MARRTLAGALLLLAACGHSSRVEDVPEIYRQPRAVIPPAPDLHLYGHGEVGAWATYQEPRRTLTVAIVGREGDKFWFEEIDEGEPRQVSARLVAPDGVVERAYYAELFKDGSRTPPALQALLQTPETGPRLERETGREEFSERVKIGGRELDCRGERIRYEDLEGRREIETYLWCPEVPKVYEGHSTKGGLVRRVTRVGTVELQAFGADAKPHLVLPPPK